MSYLRRTYNKPYVDYSVVAIVNKYMPEYMRDYIIDIHVSRNQTLLIDPTQCILITLIGKNEFNVKIHEYIERKYINATFKSKSDFVRFLRSKYI